jgi:hypothetical protein
MKNYGRVCPQLPAAQHELLPGFRLATQPITAKLQLRQLPPKKIIYQ